MVVGLMILGVVVILGAMIAYLLHVISSAYPKEAPSEWDDPVVKAIREETPCPHCGCKRLDYEELPQADEYRCANCGTLRVRLGVL